MLLVAGISVVVVVWGVTVVVVVDEEEEVAGGGEGDADAVVELSIVVEVVVEVKDAEVVMKEVDVVTFVVFVLSMKMSSLLLAEAVTAIEMAKKKTKIGNNSDEVIFIIIFLFE